MRLQSDQWAAILTLTLVASINLWLQARTGADSAQLVATLAIFLGFGAGFLYATSKFDLTSTRVFGVLITQYLLVLLLFWLSPYTFNAILLVIWSALLPYVMPYRVALLSSPLWSFPPWLLAYWFSERQGLGIAALLFWTFNIFALVMMQTRRTAEQQRQQAEQANSALRANELLVQQAARAQERTRIARDIHDLVGHHLTALIINLQVAQRRSAGEAADTVGRCEAIARLLMADVREAVSELREDDQLDLQAAVASLAETFPGLTLNFTLAEGTRIQSVQVAAVLLRCIQEAMTNAVRHGGAQTINIQGEQNAGELQITIHDNGRGCPQPNAGNGLQGMRERLAELGGQLHIGDTARGFELQLRIPHGH